MKTEKSDESVWGSKQKVYHTTPVFTSTFKIGVKRLLLRLRSPLPYFSVLVSKVLTIFQVSWPEN